jgi:hypothetical protein
VSTNPYYESIANDLREIAARLDEVPADTPPLFTVRISCQPHPGGPHAAGHTEQARMRTVEAVADAVLDRNPTREPMSTGTTHYDATGRVGSAEFAVYTRLWEDADQAGIDGAAE